MLLGISSDMLDTLTAYDVITFATKNSLAAIEWSDQHIPVGNVAEAKRIADHAQSAGIRSLSYRPAYDIAADSITRFDDILQTAKALQASTITLSPFFRAEENDVTSYVQTVQKLADKAAALDCKICLSCCAGSLLDSYILIQQFIKQVNRLTVSVNWQPNRTSSLLYNIYELKMLAPYVHHVYVVYSDPVDQHAAPIVEGQDEWQQYLKVLSGSGQALLFKHYLPDSFSSECLLMQDWIQKSRK